MTGSEIVPRDYGVARSIQSYLFTCSQRRISLLRGSLVFGIISSISSLVQSEPISAGRRRPRRLRAEARSCWTAWCDIGRTGPGGASCPPGTGRRQIDCSGPGGATLSARDRAATDRLHGPGRSYIDRTGRATSSRPTGTTPSRWSGRDYPYVRSCSATGTD